MSQQPTPGGGRSNAHHTAGPEPELTEAADADLAEQLQPAEPDPDDDDLEPPPSVPLEADPADVFEQRLVVPAEPDDYR